MSGARWRLHGLARNPGAPAGILLRILASGDDDVRRALLWRPGVPAEVHAAAASHPDAGVRLLLADNWYVPAARRALLAADPSAAVRAAVAAGPNPFHAEVPFEPLPAGTCVVLARDPDPAVREELALCRRTPAEARAVLVTDPEPDVRAIAVAWWEDPPEDVIDALLTDPSPHVREAAARAGYRTRPPLAAALLDGPGAAEVAADAPLDRPDATRLARSPDPSLRAAVAANPHLPADLADELSRDPDPAVRLAASLRPELTEEQRAAIDYAVEPGTVLDPPRWTAGPGVLRRCATSAHPVLRQAAARSPRLPPDLVETLARDPDTVVRALLAEHHPDAPADLLLRTLLESPLPARWTLLDHPAFPREALSRLADSDDPFLRTLIVHDPRCPPATVERLLTDPDDLVRLTMAADPRLPQPRILELLHDPDLAGAAASNPALPAEAVHAILTEAGIP
ncbi:hypothetical protein [Actinomadura parmotrematis]|uniref:Leucine rich repeat variant n=1 Tax=Actinomadura parmotrematis TaxID=2864039 RepID=A0ABS7FKB1_9ACTN|nr:hypothetical protein [Actinomadura parmotrematis]MBW8480801.1 hypothetical protein [Actinomadura parmotrematis]